MGLAAKIPDPAPEELFREMIHDEVDKWVDEIVADVFRDDRQPTLTELSDLFAQTKQKFFGACLQTLVEQSMQVCAIRIMRLSRKAESVARNGA